MMKVCEIFASIQGESSFAGMPCVFVRLTGCNLRCVFCDTKYSYDEGVEMDLDKVVETVKAYGIKLVELTGGEPLLQKEPIPLIQRLHDEGLNVLLETNGSMNIGDVDARTVIIMDIKTPGSGMCGKTDLSNIGLLKPTDEVKFVIADREDYKWSMDFIMEHGLLEKCGVLLSPAFGVMPPATLAGWMVKDTLPARLNMQLHKYIYPSDKRGV
jgi:7-carboxy-7-deazaguanine synthase